MTFDARTTSPFGQEPMSNVDLSADTKALLSREGREFIPGLSQVIKENSLVLLALNDHSQAIPKDLEFARSELQMGLKFLKDAGGLTCVGLWIDAGLQERAMQLLVATPAQTAHQLSGQLGCDNSTAELALAAYEAGLRVVGLKPAGLTSARDVTKGSLDAYTHGVADLITRETSAGERILALVTNTDTCAAPIGIGSESVEPLALMLQRHMVKGFKTVRFCAEGSETYQKTVATLQQGDFSTTSPWTNHYLASNSYPLSSGSHPVELFADFVVFRIPTDAVSAAALNFSKS